MRRLIILLALAVSAETVNNEKEWATLQSQIEILEVVTIMADANGGDYRKAVGQAAMVLTEKAIALQKKMGPTR